MQPLELVTVSAIFRASVCYAHWKRADCDEYSMCLLDPKLLGQPPAMVLYVKYFKSMNFRYRQFNFVLYV